MRQFYYVPDRCSRTLSDRGSSVFFRNGRDLPDDIYLRCCCNMACRMIQKGWTWQAILTELRIEDPELLQERFLYYTGLTPSNYRRWYLNRQKK